MRPCSLFALCLGLAAAGCYNVYPPQDYISANDSELSRLRRKKELLEALKVADCFEDFKAVYERNWTSIMAPLEKEDIVARQRQWYLDAHRSTDPDVQWAIRHKRVRIGMTSEQCLASWGWPCEINRTTSNYGTDEQWVYKEDCHDRYAYHTPSYLYLHNGVLRTIQN